MPPRFQNADEVVGELIGVAPRKEAAPLSVTPSNPLAVNADIVIVGSGLAGLCAAVSAAQKGVRVLVLELSQEIGGLTRLSTGLIGFADPDRQRPLGIYDSAERHAQQTLAFGRHRADKALVHTLCRSALDCARWLESLGIQFSPRTVQRARTLFPRGHLPLDGGGSVYTDLLALKAAALDVKFALQHELTSFAKSNNGRGFDLDILDLSTGRTKKLVCKKLILASGGFSPDSQLLSSQDPRLKNISVIATLPAVSHVHRCAAEQGILMTGLGFVQKEVFLPNGDVLPAALRNPSSYIALDAAGKRFMREDLPYNQWLEEVINRAQGSAVLIASGSGQSLGPYWTITPNLQTLAHDIGLTAPLLANAIADYNNIVDAQNDPLGKSVKALTKHITGPDYMGAQIQVRVLTTLGGIRINQNAQVLDRLRRPIAGLFAAGDVTGGIHGMHAVHGNLLLSALVFGRLAGLGAAQH